MNQSLKFSKKFQNSKSPLPSVQVNIIFQLKLPGIVSLGPPTTLAPLPGRQGWDTQDRILIAAFQLPTPYWQFPNVSKIPRFLIYWLFICNQKLETFVKHSQDFLKHIDFVTVLSKQKNKPSHFSSSHIPMSCMVSYPLPPEEHTHCIIQARKHRDLRVRHKSPLLMGFYGFWQDSQSSTKNWWTNSCIASFLRTTLDCSRTLFIYVQWVCIHVAVSLICQSWRINPVVNSCGKEWDNQQWNRAKTTSLNGHHMNSQEITVWEMCEKDWKANHLQWSYTSHIYKHDPHLHRQLTQVQTV